MNDGLLKTKIFAKIGFICLQLLLPKTFSKSWEEFEKEIQNKEAKK